MATIKAIEGRSIHQIQSGQVIVDLQSVVKELVENSLDAGASSIEIRFKNQGLDSLEVQDNGKGIAPEDYETVALKHHTSKLSDYEDLTSLDTFGFRGEALSSLCALSDFHIVTARAEDGAVGKRLDFETSGKLKGSSVTAAQMGTTVAVENLFCNLPVRRKELEKNIKREYGKVISSLYAYACISVGVRFSVTNQMPKGKKVAIFSTKSNTTTKENIVNVYGAKTLLALIKLDLRLGMEPNKGPSTQNACNWATQSADRSTVVHVQGHISRPTFGEGRQAPDRQMFFVNSRPCQLPQVSKAINEVYKAFNVTQSPFIFANLVMDTNAYDVNVSPDKRTILLHDQTTLLESLKAALTELFERTDHTLPQSQLPSRKLPAYQPLSIQKRMSTNVVENGNDVDPDASDDESELPEHATTERKPRLDGNQADTPPNLIHSWIGRDTEARREMPAPKRPSVNASREERRAVKPTLQHGHINREDSILTDVEVADIDRPRANEAGTHPSGSQDEPHGNGSFVVRDIDGPSANDDEDPMEPAQEADPMGSCYSDLSSQRPTHLHEQHQSARAPPVAETSHAPDDTENDTDEIVPPQQLEPSIFVVTPGSQKTPAGPVQNAFDRMRPKRTPLQTAEITVGDTTTTMVIGDGPPYKKQRVYQPKDSQSIANFGASPSVARGLRSFAAPGSQMAADASGMTPADLRGGRDDTDPILAGSSDSEDPDEEDDQCDGDSLRDANVRTSDPLDDYIPAPADHDECDEDYVDEGEKKVEEDEKVARLIQEAEESGARPSEDNLRRASQAFKNSSNRKESTLRLACYLGTTTAKIKMQAEALAASTQSSPLSSGPHGTTLVKDELDDSNAESRLSLTVKKADFERMSIIGQFNLGFILALRPAASEHDDDDLFIIDQHAADEKYNYERLQRTVTLQNQRLVHPKPLELTALEEEVVLSNIEVLKANGFDIEISAPPETEEGADDDSNDIDVPSHHHLRRRCCLLALPVHGSTTFTLSDLEELLHLLSETPASGGSTIPRPRKVQRVLAMRACRSSIMVGRTLTGPQMGKVVRHMGEMEKPWNCPHGRPTMRHLAGLGGWRGWREGEEIREEEEEEGGGGVTDWREWVEGRK